VIFSSIRRLILYGQFCVGIVLVMTGCSSDNNVTVLTFEKSLADITNVAMFAHSPRGKTLMESSFDRTGGNDDWAKLEKRDHFGDYILVDLKGPGIVHRIWMTGIPDKQKLYFYFDDDKNARVKTTIEGFFGKESPFLPPLCDHVSGGYYSYLPMPFQKSFRITLPKGADNVDRPYFHVNYELYDQQTKIESFPKLIDGNVLHLIEDACKNWIENSNTVSSALSSCSPAFSGEIPASGSSVLLARQGEGVLAAFSIKMIPPAEISALAKSRLGRELILSIYWDGQSNPSVCTPIGDFFCNPLRKWEFVSMPLAVTRDEFICRFPMYFGKSARIVLLNRSSVPVKVETSVNIQKCIPSTEKMYFHAMWNASVSPQSPHMIFNSAGKGHYVGCNLLAIGMDGSWNILESDELVYIDGETFPSLHGTGLEDYFNGGWYYYGLFLRPLHGLIEKAPIRTTQYRFHLGDAISFNKNILMNFEFGDSDRNRSSGYMSSVAYWYQDRPVPVKESCLNVPLVIPPDPMEPTAIMSALFEMERSEKYDAAEKTCYEYIEKYPQSPFNEMLKLRAVAYCEKQHKGDFPNRYKKILDDSSSDEVKKQAADLMWIHENSSNALLVTSFNGAAKVFLDGQLVSQGDDPFRANVMRLTLTPGQHTFAAEFTRLRPYAWLSVQLRTVKNVINTDKSWSLTDNIPALWPMVDENTNGWFNSVEEKGCPPYMSFWQFYPNAMVACQAVNFISLNLPFPGWSKDGKKVYFKKTFTIE